jgi:hypothetical protein
VLVEAAISVPVGVVAADTAGVRNPGRLRMLFSGTVLGGGVSLNTLRPVPSTHCHCANAALLARVANTTNAHWRHGRKEDFLRSMLEV